MQPDPNKDPFACNAEAREISRRCQRESEEQQRKIKMSKTYHLDVTIGVQAKRQVFNATIPFKLLVDLIEIDWAKLAVEDRSQRIPSKPRVRKLKDYLVEYQDTYILPPLTASIEGEYEFDKYEGSANAGVLSLKPGVKLHLLDGGHRRKAAEEVLKEIEDMAYESIGIYLVGYRGLPQQQQWFSTINQTMQRVPKAQGLQYDRTDRNANFNREVVDSIPLFSKYTNREQGSPNGNKLFVLTWFFSAHQLMRSDLDYNLDLAFCRAFWEAAIANIPDWKDYDPAKVDPKKAREKISSTAIFLKALASIAGEMAFGYARQEQPDMAEKLNNFLAPLKSIKWDKDNPELQGVIVQDNKILTRNQIQLIEFLKGKLIKPSSTKSPKKGN